MAHSQPNGEDRAGRSARSEPSEPSPAWRVRLAGIGQPLRGRAAKRVAPLWEFWTKVTNDWIFNLAGLLAYNLLLTSFPILLVVLAAGGFFLGSLAPSAQRQFATKIAEALPGGVHGAGGTIVNAATYNLAHSAGVLLVVGIIGSLIIGSGLFVVLENCFGVIFKLRGRRPIVQNLMAIGMLLFFVALLPFILLASIVPAAIIRALPLTQQHALASFLVQAAGVAVAASVACILFGAIYLIVPNRHVRLREVWRGTLVAAGMLVIYEIIFPIYVSTFLHPHNYGSSAGFALVILLFFYYLGLILLFGAEVNSWAMGQREMAGDIVAVLHEVQAHNTTRGAAGPLAGTPREDIEHHEGAAAMRSSLAAVAHERVEHRDDALPPKFAESGVQPPGYVIESDAELARAKRAVQPAQPAPPAARSSGFPGWPRPAWEAAAAFACLLLAMLVGWHAGRQRLH
jgi:membrane protein